MNSLLDAIQKAGTIAISGHVRPDGDAIGSSMGLYFYLRDNYPEKQVDVYLEEVPDSFSHIRDDMAMTVKCDKYDLFVVLDCGDEERLGDTAEIIKKSDFVLNIDHHITNTMFGNENIVDAKSSSTCQVLFTLMEEEKISKLCAMALYTGIIHDTGVFKHNNTSYQTMIIAGQLMSKGIAFGEIIDSSFYNKTYKQLKILGHCLTESERELNGLVIYSVMKLSDMDAFNAKPSDLDGVIDELRTTEGVEVAILISERNPGEFKVSMRANQVADVSSIAKEFGGGGHIKASGCTIKDEPENVIKKLVEKIRIQLCLDDED
ncbi:MAG: bifunctional oligoribonuclease/PAP phosphatase NrnA [Eubacterium sp.]|nr:bifunctional oligoribonuclease/PAP phosphatase NrnA [Eubacterium sp.]